MQKNDPEISCIVSLRLQQEKQPQIYELLSESEETKILWSQWFRLVVRNGVVYRVLFSKSGEPDVLQLLAPKTLRTGIMQGSHEGMAGGHFRVRRTLDQIQKRAYWIGWRRDVKRFCRQCQNCNCYHRGQLPKTAHLQPIATGAPFERLSIDLTGPHVRSKRGSVYILTCVDPFTKWAEAFGIPNKEATTVARVLVDRVFCRFGVPLALLSDDGKEVDSTIMREICTLLRIDKMRTTVYKPSTNSACERFHKTLNCMIGKVLDDNQKDWDTVLPYVMVAYRSTRHETTGYSPNFLTLGREVRAPIDIVLGSPEEDGDTLSYDDFVEDLRQRMLKAYALVRQHSGTAAERSKHYYDLRVRPQQYHVGDLVYFFNPRNRQNKQNKWLRKYTGPFEVVRVLGPVNVLLRKSERSKPFVAHLDKLKQFPANTGECRGEIKEAESVEKTDSREEPVQTDVDGTVHGYGHCDRQFLTRPRRNIRKPSRYDC